MSRHYVGIRERLIAAKSAFHPAHETQPIKHFLTREPLPGEGFVPGKYWAVVDYNGDNEFTNELDASVTFIVKERSVDPAPPKPKVAAVADVYTVTVSGTVSPVVAPFEQKSVASSPPEFEHVAHGASLFDDEWDFDAVSGLLLGSRRETDHAPVLRPPF